MKQLENPHFATCNEVMDLDNRYQWKLKPLGKRLMGHFPMKAIAGPLKIIKSGIDQFNIIKTRTHEETCGCRILW